jgi:hypothetical protein
MASLLDMAQARLQGLLDLPARAGRALVDPTVFSGLLGAPTLPKERGIAQAAYGLPPEPNMSVLNPEQAAYMQGYAQGEPLSYLGLLAPFTAPAAVAGAKAVAPQAGMALENYMAKQGLIQPLTAFHGTPHNIQGKFDINKVGTGEGAQAYGYGMYFAENPTVATQYKNILSKPEFTKTGEGIELRGQLPRMLDESYDELVAKNGIQQTNYGDVTDIVGQRLDRQMKDALKANDMDWYNKTADMKIDLARFRENPPPNVGNLYKVDIPDEYIPNMLLWDEPLSKQPKAVQKALEKLDPNMYSPKGADYDSNDLGQLIYERLTNTADKPLRDAWVKKRDELLKKGIDNNPELMAHLDTNPNPYAETSKLLDSLGIKGIKYKDEGSRSTNLSTNTYNFVVFDPTDVKILEKNSKKVE